MFPIDFYIKGPPVSHQTKNKERLRNWKQRVKNAATKYLPANFEITFENLTIEITFFYEGHSPDVDNVIKPIQDALIGLIYEDDSQFTDTHSRKRALSGSYTIDYTPALADGFGCGQEFVYVKINISSNLEVL